MSTKRCIKQRIFKGSKVNKTQPEPSAGGAMATVAGAMTTAARAGQQQMTSYLESNPEFLENYVLANVDLETLERWIIRKARNLQKEHGGM